MISDLTIWVDQWGGIASIVGLLVSVLGFTATLLGVWRSKSAAEQAKKAAEATRNDFEQYDAIVNLSSAMAIMDEIKRLQRHQAWATLPDRYSELRRRLVAIRESHVQLNESHRTAIQGAIETFIDVERRIEQAIARNVTPRNPAKLNEIVSSQIDEVHAILLSHQRTLGGTR